MEQEMDLFLTLLAMELSLHQSLERALATAAGGVRGPLRTSMQEAVDRYVHQGEPLDESLLEWKTSHESPLLNRVAAVLMHLHVQGNSPTTQQSLRHMAEDIRLHHRNELRRFASQLTLLSVVFIGTSTLVPTLFLGFVAVGSQFLDLTLAPEHVWGTALVGIPLLNALILLLVWVQNPIVPVRDG
ncbi:MAG: type II secretion system F family protein [Candidatus Diapherotrites archaeon]|nr:type II secretion system F family protein [Candidatus Diapherotrites archaeon]MDZ4256200.1 type II secretion system F family protein [archaeon]